MSVEREKLKNRCITTSTFHFLLLPHQFYLYQVQFYHLLYSCPHPQFTAAVGKKFFLGKKRNFGYSKLVSKALSLFIITYYCFTLKARLAFSVNVAMFVPKKWLNIRISVALFRQLLRQKWDLINTHTYMPLDLSSATHIARKFKPTVK